MIWFLLADVLGQLSFEKANENEVFDSAIGKSGASNDLQNFLMDDLKNSRLGKNRRLQGVKDFTV